MSATISTLVWALIVIIVVIILVVVLFKVLSYLVVLPEVYGQQNKTPITLSGEINPSLQFIPQQAYIQTVPPSGVGITPSPTNSPSTNNDLQDMIIPILVSAGGILAAKFTTDKKANENHKANASQILKTKENVKELARVTYDMNPEAAAKIDDAPTVKIQTLTNDVSDYAQHVAEI